MKLWGLEPAMIVGVITALISLLISYGVNVTNEQTESIKNFAEAVLIVVGFFVVRQQVTPTAKVEAAHGKEGVEQAAAVTKAQL